MTNGKRGVVVQLMASLCRSMITTNHSTIPVSQFSVYTHKACDIPGTAPNLFGAVDYISGCIILHFGFHWYSSVKLSANTILVNTLD